MFRENFGLDCDKKARDEYKERKIKLAQIQWLGKNERKREREKEERNLQRVKKRRPIKRKRKRDRDGREEKQRECVRERKKKSTLPNWQ